MEKIDQAFAKKGEQDNRIEKASGLVYTRLEKAIVGVSYADQGENEKGFFKK
jgi:hypothetical protein